jgi:hypothetical protein
MKRFMIPALALAVMSTPALASSSTMPCSIHAAANTPDKDLPALAKISRSAAEKTALDSIRADSKKVDDGELEVEHGCLIYSFDIKVTGKSGIEEIAVDAGTGKIIDRDHETPKKEAAETAADKAAANKAK